MKRKVKGRTKRVARSSRFALLLAVALLLPAASAGGNEVRTPSLDDGEGELQVSTWDPDSRLSVNRSDVRSLVQDRWAQ